MYAVTSNQIFIQGSTSLLAPKQHFKILHKKFLQNTEKPNCWNKTSRFHVAVQNFAGNSSGNMIKSLFLSRSVRLFIQLLTVDPSLKPTTNKTKFVSKPFICIKLSFSKSFWQQSANRTVSLAVC